MAQTAKCRYSAAGRNRIILPEGRLAIRTITLIRHAKAQPPAVLSENGISGDFGRILAPKGRNAARRLGEILGGQPPDAVLCSPSARTRETLELMWEGLNAAQPDLLVNCETNFDRQLYLADAATIGSLIAELREAAHSVWVVGHNPGIHDLLCQVARDNRWTNCSQLLSGFPTAAFASFTCDATDWRVWAKGQCLLQQWDLTGASLSTELP